MSDSMSAFVCIKRVLSFVQHYKLKRFSQLYVICLGLISFSSDQKS